MELSRMRQLFHIITASGGIVPTGENLKRAEHADLITLPSSVSGTNCGNCKFVAVKGDKHFCEHPEVKQEVTARMCCAFWDNEGVNRPWEKK